MAGRQSLLNSFIVPRDQVTRVVQTYMVHPVVLAIFAYSAVVETVFGIRAPLAVLPFVAQLGVNAFIASLNVCILYFTLGAVFHWAVQRNFPMLFTLFLYILAIGTVEMVFISLAMTGGVEPVNLLNCLFRLSLITGISEILALAYFREMLLERLAVDPTRFPLFWPAKAHRDRLQHRLAESQRGLVLRLEALGQYVAVVTDKGRSELRLSLKDAISELPPDTGIQVHRSLWVRFDQISAVVYHNGNPRLRTVTGEILLLGRKMVEPVKAAIIARTA